MATTRQSYHSNHRALLDDALFNEPRKLAQALLKGSPGFPGELLPAHPVARGLQFLIARESCSRRDASTSTLIPCSASRLSLRLEGKRAEQKGVRFIDVTTGIGQRRWHGRFESDFWRNAYVMARGNPHDQPRLRRVPTPGTTPPAHASRRQPPPSTPPRPRCGSACRPSRSARPGSRR